MSVEEVLNDYNIIMVGETLGANHGGYICSRTRAHSSKHAIIYK